MDIKEDLGCASNSWDMVFECSNSRGTSKQEKQVQALGECDKDLNIQLPFQEVDQVFQTM